MEMGAIFFLHAPLNVVTFWPRSPLPGILSTVPCMLLWIVLYDPRKNYVENIRENSNSHCIFKLLKHYYYFEALTLDACVKTGYYIAMANNNEPMSYYLEHWKITECYKKQINKLSFFLRMNHTINYSSFLLCFLRWGTGKRLNSTNKTYKTHQLHQAHQAYCNPTLLFSAFLINCNQHPYSAIFCFQIFSFNMRHSCLSMQCWYSVCVCCAAECDMLAAQSYLLWT